MNIFKIFILIIGLATFINAHNYYLHGKVTNFSEDGIEYPVKNESISINGTGVRLKTTTDNEGKFHLNLAPGKKPLLEAGDKVRLHMDLSNKWFMLSPYNGNMFLPINSKNIDISIKLLANKSKIKTKSFTINIDNGKKEKAQYCIQILSVNSYNSAKKIKDTFNKKWKNKYNAYIEILTLKQKKVYKVLVSISPYTKSNTIEAKNKIRKKYKGAFIRLVVR